MHHNQMILIILANTALCFAQFGAEKIDQKRGKIPLRHSLIPGTKEKFLHWEDYYSSTYGDLLGMPLVIYGFYQLIPHLSSYELISFGPLCIVSNIFYLAPRLLSVRRISWGEPAIGKISLGGYVHSFYFALLLSMLMMCFYGALTHKITSPTTWMVVLGISIWGAFFMADIRSGHFKDSKQES